VVKSCLIALIKTVQTAALTLSSSMMLKSAVKIPVIASSGAGNPGHFRDVFEQTATDAALGTGMFHRREYTVGQVTDLLQKEGLLVRPLEIAEA